MLIHEITNYLDVGLICTELVRNKNKWVPRIIGENCNGKQKVNEDWKNWRGISSYYAQSSTAKMRGNLKGSQSEHGSYRQPKKPKGTPHAN